MKIAAWLVVKEEDYYVGMAIKSVAPFVDAIYVQDQYSQDNTIENIKEAAGSTKLCIDRIDTGLDRFDGRYNEPYFRTLAINRCEQHFQPDWLLQIDADEIYTPEFFNIVNELQDSGELEKYNGLRHATERFITPHHYSQSSHALQTIEGKPYYDPHTRFWRACRDVKYVNNPKLSGFLHCVLRPNPEPLLWVPGIMHIHLHRTFGPKAFPFWREGGDKFEEVTPFNPQKQAPKWFAHELAETAYTDFQWPDYVMEIWNKWGIYE